MPCSRIAAVLILLVVAACSHEEPVPSKPPPPAAGKTGPAPVADAGATPAKKPKKPEWSWSDSPDLFPLVGISLVIEGGHYRLAARGKAAPRLSRTNADGSEAWSVDPGIEAGELAGAAVIIDSKRLYVAHYHRIATGCQLTAWSREDGKKLWSVRLEGVGSVGHSKYSNRVQLGFWNGAPTVYGHESASRYIEVRDPATGALRHNEKLPSTTLVRPLSEALYRELANRLAKKPKAEVAVADFLARHNFRASDDEVQRAIGQLQNLELGGGGYQLTVKVTSRGTPLLRATRVAVPATCKIVVTGLAEATINRGPIPIAPYQEQYYRDNPGAAKRRNSEGHGDHHLRCTYEVTVNGKRYRYPHNISNTGRIHETSHCKTLQPTIAGEILSFTERCTNFAHGEFYGFRLIPTK